MGRHPLFIPYAALASVCFFWGTTYVAIKMALEMFPPIVLVAARFILSGGALLIYAKLAGHVFPPHSILIRTALNGALTLGIANGCVVFAETFIPSGMAALFITTTPFWMTFTEAIVPGGAPLHRPTIIGMIVGFAGVAILIGPDALGQSADLALLWGFLLLQFGNFGWATGSIFQKRLPKVSTPIITGGLQQITVGLLYLIPVLIFRPELYEVSTRGVSAFVYLIIFGSIVGYSSYIIALERLPIAIVSIFTYVNPLVAVILGWLIYREPFGWRQTLAMCVIFLGVWLVKKLSVPMPVKQPS